MSRKPIYTPVERLDGLLETGNRAEKWMHQSRYRLAATRLGPLARRAGRAGRASPDLASPLCVLDVACGMGYGSKILAQTLDARVTSIDIEAQALDYARAHHPDARISYQQGSITRIPAPKRRFRCRGCYETIEHLNLEEARRALAELSRVLKPGGVLFISSPNRYFTFLLELLGMKNPYHFYEFRPEELARELEKAGLQTQRVYGQTLALPITYYLGRAGKLAPQLFFPRRALLAQGCMIAVLEARKTQTEAGADANATNGAERW